MARKKKKVKKKERPKVKRTKSFQRRRKYVFWGFVLGIVSLIAAYTITDIKSAAVFWFAAILIGHIVYHKGITNKFLLAFLLALLIAISFDYNYVGNNLAIFGLSLYPLGAWWVGLLILGEIYDALNLKHKLLASILIYFVLFIIIEYIGYHVLGVRLDSNYESLFGMGIVHGPIQMKVTYVLVGPVYVLLLSLLKRARFKYH